MKDYFKWMFMHAWSETRPFIAASWYGLNTQTKYHYFSVDIKNVIFV